MNKLILTILFLLFTINAEAYTETFYVCQGGNGSAPEDGTCGNAWDIDDVNASGNWDADAQTNDGRIGPDDLVIFLDDGGTLTGSSTGAGKITIYQSGTASYYITLQGESGGSPIIDGENEARVINCGTSNKDYIIIEDLELKNGEHNIIRTYGDDNWIIRNNILHDTLPTSTNDGTILKMNGNNNLVQGNTIYGVPDEYGGGPTKTYGAHGMYLTTGNDNVFEYNRVYEIYSHTGMKVNASSAQYGNIFRYNWISGCDYSCLAFETGSGEIYGNICIVTEQGEYSDYGFIVDQGSGGNPNNIKIYNNVIYGDADALVMIGNAGTASVHSLYNNIFYQTSGNNNHYFILKASNGTLSASDNNQFYNTSGGDTNRFNWNGATPDSLSAWQSASSLDASSDDANPTFINVGTDFTLASDSPCVDAGKDLGNGVYEGIDPQYNLVTSFGQDSPIALLDHDSYGGGWEIGAYVYDPGGQIRGTFTFSGGTIQ